MRTKGFLLIFCFLPFLAFSQTAIIKNLYPVVKHRHKTDTIKSICFPEVYSNPGNINKEVNNTIREGLLGVSYEDSGITTETLLSRIYAKHKEDKITYKTTYNKNGFLSITIHTTPSGGAKQAPLFFNFDLKTGRLITISEMLKTKNDSVSFRESAIHQITDSVRLFEQTIDKNNPKYGEIIENLNTTLSEFRSNYTSDFYMTEKEIVVVYYCIIPKDLMPYMHVYKMTFTYKILRNIFKPEIVTRLL